MKELKLEKRLRDVELACEIAHSYEVLISSLTGWELNKAIANWKIEVYEYIKEANSADVDYILEYLYREGAKAYLDVLIIITEYKGELAEVKPNFFNIFSIKNKKEKRNERVCSSSRVYHRDNVNDSNYTEFKGSN